MNNRHLDANRTPDGPRGKRWRTKGGYPSGDTPVSELKPPPKTAGAGVKRKRRGGTYLNPSSDWYGE